MKRITSLVLAGLLAGLAPQITSAQTDSDNHNVTVDVAQITSISGLSSVSFDGPNGNGFENLNTPDTESASYDITNNVRGRKVEVSASQNGSTDLTGLRLDLDVSGSPSGSNPGTVGFTSLGSGLTTSAQDLLTGLDGVDETVNLTYTAEVDERFDPSAQADLQITFTVTSDGS